MAALGQVPAGLAANDAVPVVLSLGGIASNTVTIAVYQGYEAGRGRDVFVKPESGWATMAQTAKLTASDGAAMAGATRTHGRPARGPPRYAADAVRNAVLIAQPR